MLDIKWSVEIDDKLGWVITTDDPAILGAIEKGLKHRVEQLEEIINSPRKAHKKEEMVKQIERYKEYMKLL